MLVPGGDGYDYAILTSENEDQLLAADLICTGANDTQFPANLYATLDDSSPSSTLGDSPTALSPAPTASVSPILHGTQVSSPMIASTAVMPSVSPIMVGTYTSFATSASVTPMQSTCSTQSAVGSSSTTTQASAVGISARLELLCEVWRCLRFSAVALHSGYSSLAYNRDALVLGVGVGRKYRRPVP